MSKRSESHREPQPPMDIGPSQSQYNGRNFYGVNASDRAELTYLRDWQRWAIEELKLSQ